MGSYTTIADTSKSILEFVRRVCCPEPVEQKETIGLCQPDDMGNFTTGIYLYNITENTQMRTASEIVIDENHVKAPPTSLTLSYMIFTALKSEVATRSYDEQRIIGMIHQQLAENRVLEGEAVYGTLRENKESLYINYINVPYDEKIRVWSTFNMGVRLCLFYEVGPVMVESTKIKEAKRVREAGFILGQKSH